MPTVNPGESRKDFVSRCIPVVLKDGSASSQDQAIAMCFNIFKEHKKKQKHIAASASGQRLSQCPRCSSFNVSRRKGEKGHGPTDHCRDCSYGWPVVPGTTTAAQLAFSGDIVLDASHLEPAKEVPLGLEGLPTFEEIPTDEIASKKPDGTPIFKMRQVPIRYYLKEVARVGDWTHRGQINAASGEHVVYDLTADRLDQWIENFQARKAAGILPFIPDYHTKVFDASLNNGQVIDLKREGDSVKAVLKIVGEKAIEKTLKNDVSIYVKPEAVDSYGKKYREVVDHVCLTPNPAFHLDGFVRIAASADCPAESVPVFVPAVHKPSNAAPSRRSYRMKPEMAQQVRAKLGFGADIPDDQLDDKAAEKAIAFSADVARLTKERDDATKAANDAKAEAAAIAASADAPKKADPMFRRNVKEARQRAINSGIVTEAEAKEFDALLKNANGEFYPAAFSVVGTGDDEVLLGFDLWDKLAKLSGNGLRTGRAPRPGDRPAQPVRASADDAKDEEELKKIYDDAKKYKEQQLQQRGMATA